MGLLHTRVEPTCADEFRTRVYDHYYAHGRDFPWRHSTDPYHILVSEVMLQQTQAARVLNKYHLFVYRFPDFQTLSQASAIDVLRAWQGLGYNRRALALLTTANKVCSHFSGCLPHEKKELLALPGIGPYTAAAIRAFAFDLPEVFIETNIRTVFLHEFFPGTEGVRDRELLPLIEMTLDRKHPRRWYHALMDYGVKLKEEDNAARRSAHHRPQSRFRGSRREARGSILRTLLQTGPLPTAALASRIGSWDARFDDALTTLQRDGLVMERDSVLSVTT